MMKSFLRKPAAIVMGSVLALQAIPMTLFAAVADITPPTSAITSPLNGATVSGTVSVAATATDRSIPLTDCLVTLFGIQYDVTSLQSTHSGGNIFACGTDMTTVYQGQHGTNVSRMTPYIIPASGISKVDLYVDGVLTKTASTTPYTFSWDTTTVPNGSRALIAVAYDLAGNHTNSTTVNVTVNNVVAGGDTTAPLAAITSPVGGATVTGLTTITASSTDNVGVTKVEFYVDNVLKSTSTATTSPYTASWDTTTATNGTHSLMVKAYDAAGNVGSSPVTTVTVSNTVVTPPGGGHGHGDDQNENEQGEGSEHGGNGQGHQEHGNKHIPPQSNGKHLGELKHSSGSKSD